jgi:DNA-directed RNA polymerase subunit RPC12/RpoP
MSTQEQQGPSSSGMPPGSGDPTNPLGPENPPCPTCERRMVVRQVMPVLFASGLDDVVYGCEKCGTEAKRTIKRTWIALT